MYCKILSLIIVLVSFSASSFGQEELEQEQVEVIKNFEAKLSESERLDVNPSLPPIDTSNRKISYDIPAKAMNIDYAAPQIKPIAMNAKALPKAFKTYLKGGYGTPKAVYAEASHFQKINNNIDILGKVLHQQANNKNIAFQKFINTGVNLESNYTTSPTSLLKTSVGYLEEVDHFYGYDHEVLTFTEEEIKQKFKTLNFAGQYEGEFVNSFGLNYGLGASYLRKADAFSTKEENFILNANLRKDLKDKHPLQLKVIADLSNLEVEEKDKQNLNLLNLQPSFTFHQDKFRLDFGTNLIFSDGNFNLLPFIEATANILSKQVVAFAGWESNLKKNTFTSLTDFNPYLISDPTIFIAKYNDFYGGVKGKIRSFDYSAMAGYKNIDKLPLYVNSINDPKRFEVLTDSVSIFYLEGILNFQLFSNLNFIGSFTQKVYNLSNEKKAWHLPALELNLALNYKLLEEKLNLKAKFFSTNPIPYLDINENKVDRLNAQIDFNLGAEYWINDKLSFFVDGNNLFNNKRERWHQYDTFGINVLGGISARF